MENVNPFQACVDSFGGYASDMEALACIVKVAHQSSDIWAACRAFRAIALHSGSSRDLATYLSGRFFMHWFETERSWGQEDVTDFDALREHARAFLGESK